MAKTILKSGDLKIEISFNDRTNQYKAKLCPTGPRARGERCETVTVGLPGQGYSTSSHGRALAVDDPRAYKQAASAAISFARDDIQNYASGNRRGTGWHIAPPKRRRRR